MKSLSGFKIEEFKQEYFSQIVDFVKNIWSFSEWEDSFRYIYTETIIRNNYFQNDLNFQIAKNQKLLSVIFFQRKSDKNDLKKWISDKLSNLTNEQKFSLNLCTEYLFYMDSKVRNYMKENDIKVSLFVGIEKGYGSVIFEELFDYIKNLGYKNLYLWTDCECNWEWYIRKGFELIEESVYPKFNKENTEYKTYIFKKAFQ